MSSLSLFFPISILIVFSVAELGAGKGVAAVFSDNFKTTINLYGLL